MRSPVPTISDDQLDEITQADDIIRSLALDLPQIKCDPAAKNTVQLLLNHIDTLRNHDSYAVQLDARRRRDIARLQQQNKELLGALVGLAAIAADSTGVAGYHLNGAIAEWDEFEEVAAAIAAIAKATGGQP